LRVKDGQAIVVCPFFCTDGEIKSIVSAKAGWLRKHLNKPPAPKIVFTVGALVPIVGKIFTVKVKQGNKDEVYLMGGELVFVERSSDENKRKRLFYKWARVSLSRVLDAKIAEWSGKTGLTPSSYRITIMRSLWGSCNTRTRALNFNLKLIFQDVKCIDYVVLHELAHLKYARHDYAFYGFVARFMPDYKEIKKRLVTY
jgi:hypothetical protein